MKKTILAITLCFSTYASASANFLGLTEGQCTRNYGYGEESICDSMVSNSEYINDRIKLFNALDNYFISRHWEDDSIRILNVTLTKEGIWWKENKVDRRTDFLVEFRHTESHPDHSLCTIKFRQFENQNDSNPFAP
ncbi:MAG: hypothetical protein HRT45_19525 [Bdellovibrionales bacterium]|nr:hypothetical protein [Bdellovibrionales bacterium]